MDKVIDAHFHMNHCQGEYDNNQIKTAFQKILQTVSQYNLTQINACYWPRQGSFGDELKDDYQGIIKFNTGLHLFLRDDWQRINLDDESSLDFIKVYELLFPKGFNKQSKMVIDYPKKAEAFMDFFVKKGFDKFQVHTGTFNNSCLDLLEPYLNQGIKFYLAHAAESIDYEQIDLDRLKEFKGKVFLGTSNHRALNPDVRHITKAIDSGLEDFVCFETDYGFADKTSDYVTYYDAVMHEIQNQPLNVQQKILNENAKEFL